jgi:hypothetical protein
MSEIRTLSAEQYFAAEGVSRSMLEDIIPDEGTPLKFYRRHVAKMDAKEETDAMRLGSITHRALLEPETMDGAFHVKPDGMKFSTKDGKAWQDDHGDRPIISTGEFARMAAMRTAVWNHKAARKFLEGAQRERCLFGQDGKGTLRKARLDLIPASGNALADLKTCASASEFQMAKSMDKLGYNRQAAFTLDLCKLLQMEFHHWFLICVESAPPFDVVVYPVDPAAIQVGHNEIEGAIQTYRHCMETGKWPGRCDGIAEPLTLPAWRQRELDAA